MIQFPVSLSAVHPANAFRFLDPGLLIHRELEVVSPRECYIDDVLEACGHPLTRKLAPSESQVTRQQLIDFLVANPGGRQGPDPSAGRVPAYHFWMRLDPRAWPALRIAGGITLRIGQDEELALYTGHIGYHVYPPFRGHHYAERACRLLLPLARMHGLRPVWITCNPDNVPSRRTCERLGARLVEIVPIPPEHPFHGRGERHKCRYRLDDW